MGVGSAVAVETTVGDGKGVGISVTVDSGGVEVDDVSVGWDIAVGAGVAVEREVM